MCSYLPENSEYLLLLASSTLVFSGLLWRMIKNYSSTILMCPTEENQFLVDHCPSLNEYRPTPWIFNGHLMTIFGTLIRPNPQHQFERVLLTVDDHGGTVAIDWHRRPYRHQPILVILHGLTGGSEESYVRWMISCASEKLDVCCVVVHARGCGRSQLTTPTAFSAAITDDIRASFKYIRSLVGEQTPIFTVGYSLGAGILTKYLGEEGDQCLLQGAIICCACFDMMLSTNQLEQWFNALLYNRQLTKNLLRYLRRHEQHFNHTNSKVNLQNAYQSRTIREYDQHVIIPTYGFRDVEHYYSVASSNQWLKHIRVPALILSAIDDPICSIDGLPIRDVSENPNIITVQTPEGGHVSYLQGWWPRSYSYDNIVVIEYIRARLKQLNYEWNADTNEQIFIDVNQF